MVFFTVVGVIVVGLIVSKILVALAGSSIQKENKRKEEYLRKLEEKRQAEYEAMLKEAERDAMIEEKLNKITEEYIKNKSDS